jgi:hypothetical protein
MTDIDLDIYEDESLEDRILEELMLADMTSKQLAHNILGKGYTGHHIQKALLRLEADGKIKQVKRRWALA